MSSGPSAFNPTRWSLIVALRGGDSLPARAALETLCGTYWYPLYAYARRCGQVPEDAADVTQSFFAFLLEKEVFAQADPERGKLRTFLLAAMRRFMRDEWRKTQQLKRGGGLTALSIDELLAEERYAREVVDHVTPEALYHRRWALALLERTLLDLRADYAQRGKAALFEALKPCLTDEHDAASAAEVGAQLGMAAGAVRVAVSRLRHRYRERLLQEVAASMDAQSEAELDEEIDALFRVLE